MAATVYVLPSKVGGRRQHNANDEPLRVKTRPRIWTCLAEPISAKRLNNACQKNDAQTCNE